MDARSSVTERDNVTRQERIGVQYLRALEPLTTALIEAQSGAIVGQGARFAIVQAQVESFQDVDTQYGQELGVTRRWAALRARIGQLPSAGDPAVLYDLYSEATAVALALYLEVWRDALFDVDPGRDSASLQRAVTIDLPELGVAAGRFSDTIVLSRGREMTPAALADLLTLRDRIVDSGRTVIANLLDAVDATQDPRLSGLLLDEINTLQERVDTLAAAKSLTEGPVTGTDVATAGILGTAVVNGASAMYGKSLDALDSLLATRQAEVRADFIQLNLVAGAGGVLALFPLVYGVALWVRARRQPPGHAAPEDPDEAVEDTGAIAGFPVWSSAATGTRQERSVAAR